MTERGMKERKDIKSVLGRLNRVSRSAMYEEEAKGSDSMCEGQRRKKEAGVSVVEAENVDSETRAIR
jgi:hypothetical protein